MEPLSRIRNAQIEMDIEIEMEKRQRYGFTQAKGFKTSFASLKER